MNNIPRSNNYISQHVWVLGLQGPQAQLQQVLFNFSQVQLELQ